MPTVTNMALAAGSLFGGYKTAEAGVKGIDEATGAAEARRQDQARKEKDEAARLALEEERKRRKLQEESDEVTGAARNAAISRQRAAAAAAKGRSDTLLTGPLGLPGTPTLLTPGAPGKTLLGT
jgi:hypothetical protein